MFCGRAQRQSLRSSRTDPASGWSSDGAQRALGMVGGVLQLAVCGVAAQLRRRLSASADLDPGRQSESGAASRSDHGIDAGARHRPRTVTGDDQFPPVRIEGGESCLDRDLHRPSRGRRRSSGRVDRAMANQEQGPAASDPMSRPLCWLPPRMTRDRGSAVSLAVATGSRSPESGFEALSSRERKADRQSGQPDTEDRNRDPGPSDGPASKLLVDTHSP
jgi:hypothetical protein